MNIMFLSHITDISPDFKKPLSQFNNNKSLFNKDGEFKLINNICPHQGSRIINSTQKELSCQYHSWKWDQNGKPISNGTTKICNNYDILMKDAYIQNSLVFSENINLESISDCDFGHMRLVQERTEIVNSDYRNIIDVFLDVDHISIVHPEVYTKVGVNVDPEIEWSYYDWGSIQLVHKNNPYDKAFDQTLIGLPQEKLAAIWVTVYPYTTIDWQPGCLTVIVCRPIDESITETTIYKYRDIRYSDDNWKINSDIWETAWVQDSIQAENIVTRTQNLKHLEESKIHFRNWESSNGKI